MFDLLHIGHVELLATARQFGAALIVGLNTDSSVRQLGKGHDRPLVPEQERAQVLASLRSVDRVVLFAEATPLQVIEALRPDVLVKGGDYRPDQIVGGDLVRGLGGRVEIVPLIPHRSTSSLMERIRASS